MQLNDDDVEKYVRHFARVVEFDPVLAFRILLVRKVMETRGLNSTSLSELTGYGKRWVMQAISFSAIKTDGDEGTVSVGTMNLRLDVIEDAITQWTRANGGVYAVTGATEAGADEMGNQNSSTWQFAREQAGGRIV